MFGSIAGWVTGWVPTAGGPSSDFSAKVARVLQETVGVDVALLHVVEGDSEATGRQFLENWAERHQLAHVARRIGTGDVEQVIGRLALPLIW